MPGQIKTKRKLTAYSLWLALGVFGAHRFYTGRKRTGFFLLGLTALQGLLILAAFMEPFSRPWIYYFWPPYAAVENIKILGRILGPPLAENASSEAVEAATMQPLFWVLTLPAVVVTAWVLLDGVFLHRWIRPAGQRPGKVAHVSWAKKWTLTFLGLALLAYPVARGMAVLWQGYAWHEMDWNQDGTTSVGEFFEASDIGKRNVTEGGKNCVEYFAYKDGLPVKTLCPDAY